MNRIFSVWIIAASVFCCTKTSTQPETNDPVDVLDRLSSISGVEVEEITPQNGFTRQFEIYITQPLDHSQPQGTVFQQRIFISHTDTSHPVIFMPSGYSSSPVKVCELSSRMQANQIYAAHRFMAGARPESMDWEYLTVEQASADFHRVADLLNDVYTGVWMSYGVSKNGQAALFHRRYFPDDVEATVAIGAALSLGTEDPRYETFLNSAGTESDREHIGRFQRITLQKRTGILPMIEAYIAQSTFHFTRMSAPEILEYEVLEFPFSFRQVSDGDCSSIPDTTATVAELYTYLHDFGYFDFYSDELLEYYQPVYYQAFTELGWYRLIDDHLQDLLIAVPDPSYQAMAPPGAVLTFHPEVMQDVLAWLATSGDRIIHIYGADDPWSAGAIESAGSADALIVIQPGANHTVRIADLDQASLVHSTLERWLGITIQP